MSTVLSIDQPMKTAQIKLKNSFITYPEYRDSGIPWIGEIPKEWEGKIISSVFEFPKDKVSDADYEPLSVTYGGIKKQVATAAKSDDGTNRKRVLKGDIAINGRSDRKGAVGVSDYDGSISLVYHVLRKRDRETETRFFHYLFRSKLFSEEFYRWGRGIVDDLWTTRSDEMKRIGIPVPPIETQKKIAEYLDEKTALIDQIIEKKKKLIELLREKRTAVINNAVTKGLDKDVELVDSGIEWIGRMPRGWLVDKMSHYFVANDGGVWGEDDPLEEGEIVLRSTEINQDGSWDLERAITRKLSAVEFSKARLLEGDLLITKSSGSPDHLGKTAIVSEEIAERGCAYSNFMQRARLNKKILPKFFFFLINNKIGRDQINYWGLTTSGLVNLNSSLIGRFTFPIPSAQEQREIIEFLEMKTDFIDNVIGKAVESVKILKEFKSSLISNIVTGKIKV